MAQTDLKSDAWCGYNQSASPFFWVMAPPNTQGLENTYAVGEIGVPVAGGTAGSYVRSDVIDISSFLSGRDDILSKCNPPTPSLDELNQPVLNIQTQNNASILLPKYTKTKRSSSDLDSVDYNRWQPNNQIESQNLRFVIEGFANERGGMNTRNYTKLAWKPEGMFKDNTKACETVLRPGLTSDPSVSGYPGVNPITGEQKFVNYQAPGLPYPGYPFVGITSQQAINVGAIPCGPQIFQGLNNNEGECPVINPTMLQDTAQSRSDFPIPF